MLLISFFLHWQLKWDSWRSLNSRQVSTKLILRDYSTLKWFASLIYASVSGKIKKESVCILGTRLYRNQTLDWPLQLGNTVKVTLLYEILDV